MPWPVTQIFCIAGGTKDVWTDICPEWESMSERECLASRLGTQRRQKIMQSDADDEAQSSRTPPRSMTRLYWLLPSDNNPSQTQANKADGQHFGPSLA